MTINHLLPQDFIYEFNCDLQLIDDYLSQVKSSDISWVKTGPNQNDSYSSNGYPVPKNKNLDNWLDSCVSQVSETYFTNTKLSICDQWLTKTNFGEISSWHNHGLSIFSGLLYFEDSDVKTEFIIPNNFCTKYYDLLGPIIKENIKQTTYTITPEKGKLIILPSYIVHRISRNKQKIVRYTLAFNTFINGSISNYRTQKLSLEIKN